MKCIGDGADTDVVTDGGNKFLKMIAEIDKSAYNRIS